MMTQLVCVPYHDFRTNYMMQTINISKAHLWDRIGFGQNILGLTRWDNCIAIYSEKGLLYTLGGGGVLCGLY